MGTEYEDVMALLLNEPVEPEHLGSEDVTHYEQRCRLMGKLLAIYRYDSSFEDADMRELASTINKIYKNYSGRLYTKGIDCTEKGYDYKAIIFTREEVTREESLQIFKTYIDGVCKLNEDDY